MKSKENMSLENIFSM